MLSDRDQRRLREIERQLSHDDPALARVLTVRVDGARRVRGAWVFGFGSLMFLAGLVGVSGEAAVIGLVTLLAAGLAHALDRTGDRAGDPAGDRARPPRGPG